MSSNNDADRLGEVIVILSAFHQTQPRTQKEGSLAEWTWLPLAFDKEACAGNNGGYPYFFVDDLNLSSFEVLKFMSGVNGKLFSLTAHLLSL